GPLGQGFANGVGLAMAERFLRERYGTDVVDHRVFAICSDGDLMEGISSEAASIAGHLGLGRLVYLYDDNRITIDGSTDLSFSENVTARFDAQGWHTLTVEDGEDVEAIEEALRSGIAEEERPTLIRLRTVIAHHSPNKRGSSKAHGEALGADEVAATKAVFPGDDSYTREHAGRNVHWGIREHAMAAAVNGLALHGGIVKPYGSTFFVFTDYMRPSIRLSALMELDVLWVLTHDSVAVGEDGPTHQPIEHLAALRAIPGLTVIRPADANETVEAWRVALEEV